MSGVLSPRGRIAGSVVELATSQRGVVRVDQLAQLGYTRRMIRSDLLHGRLVPVHRNVYCMGHTALPKGGREMAAALACGPNAVVSHWDAAYLLGMLDRSSSAWPVHVTVVGDNRNHPGIKIHRVEKLSPKYRTEILGVPVVTPARALLDLAAVTNQGVVTRAANQGLVKDVLKLPKLFELIGESAGCRGIRTVRTAAEKLSSRGFTRSGAEEKLHQLVEDYGLPSAKSNRSLAGYEVDALWSAERVVVEIDGDPFHRTPEARSRDEARDAALEQEGFETLRFTPTDLTTTPTEVATSIREALHRGRLRRQHPQHSPRRLSSNGRSATFV